MKSKKTETVEIDVVTDILCDKCGKSCMGWCGNFCGVTISISGGPDSEVFPDDETVRHFDLCEHCIDEWLKTWAKDYLSNCVS